MKARIRAKVSEPVLERRTEAEEFELLARYHRQYHRLKFALWPAFGGFTAQGTPFYEEHYRMDWYELRLRVEAAEREELAELRKPPVSIEAAKVPVPRARTG